ncbi:MAG: hypothetical protein Q4B54_13950 [Coriobacteriales bacterium]|nr:hypothetical protein [Coriobacteriales bacterium]
MNDEKTPLGLRRYLLMPLALEGGMVTLCFLTSCARSGLSADMVELHVLMLMAIAVTTAAVYVAEKAAFRNDSKVALAVTVLAACVVGACAFYAVSWITSPRREIITGVTALSLAARSFCRAAIFAALTLVAHQVADMMGDANPFDDEAVYDDEIDPW